ncbi:MAG: HAD family hydrolase [Rhodanobacteraceae bacterium]|nr:HAD family hydrolase [Rhodanobacteraceae bacterium]
MNASLRIAMWSGPRNISTAMMRAWENRGDCAVSDEPLYAHYLAATGADHPARDEVIAAGESDWRKAVADLLGPAPGGAPIWYQKHMCHHLLPQMERDWIDGLFNILLIRDPAEVVASYLRARGTVSAEEIGLPQQTELYARLSASQAGPPPIIDAGEFLKDPEGHLRALCALLKIDFTPRMLKWPAGPRDSDGVWAPHWYAAVWKSTGFEAPRVRRDELDASARQVVAECSDLYASLRQRRLRAD